MLPLWHQLGGIGCHLFASVEAGDLASVKGKFIATEFQLWQKERHPKFLSDREITSSPDRKASCFFIIQKLHYCCCIVGLL